MKKYIYALCFFITGQSLFAEELKLDPATSQKVIKLSPVVRDKFLNCVINYNTQPLDPNYAYHTCECIALELNFSHAQQSVLTQLLQDSTNLLSAKVNDKNSLDSLQNKIIFLLTDKIVEFLNQSSEVGASPAVDFVTDTNSKVNKPELLDQQSTIIFGILGLMMLILLVSLRWFWTKIRSAFAQATTLNTVESLRLENFDPSSMERSIKNLGEQLNLTLSKQDQKMQILEGKVDQLQKNTVGGSIGNAEPIDPERNIATVIKAKSSNQAIYYAQQPLNGVFLKSSEQFTPRQTFYQIEVNPQRQHNGEFTLVDNIDTLQVAFNMPDTYLPSNACEIRNSGGTINTQRKWKVVSKGFVERQGSAWRITKPMIMQFD